MVGYWQSSRLPVYEPWRVEILNTWKKYQELYEKSREFPQCMTTDMCLALRNMK